MSLQSVLDNIKYTGFSPDEENFDWKFIDNGFSQDDQHIIDNLITTAYNFSPTARAMLEKSGAGEIIFYFDNFSSGGETIDWRLRIDPVFFESFNFINQHGDAVQFSLMRGIMHEMAHVIMGLRDNLNDANHAGETVDFTNKIMAELGSTDIRIAYSGGSKGTEFTTGENYSNGNDVDVALRGGALNTSLLGLGTSDILMARINEENLFVSGSGNDYLYGRDRSDELDGGPGDDYIDGGDGVDIAYFTGVCGNYAITHNQDGSYTIEDKREDSPDGTDTLVDVEFVAFTDEVTLLDGDDPVCVGRDLAFIFDLGTAMAPFMGDIKLRALEIVEEVFGQSKELAPSRVSIIAYGNKFGYHFEKIYTDYATVEANKQGVIDTINSLEANEGYNKDYFDGAVLNALYEIGDAANRFTRQLVIFSDDKYTGKLIANPTINPPAPRNVDDDLVLSDDQGTTHKTIKHFDETFIYEVYYGDDTAEGGYLATRGVDTGGLSVVSGDDPELAEKLLNYVSDQIEFSATPQDAEVNGNMQNNVIKGAAGDQIIFADGGNDEVFDALGNDQINGEGGHDKIFDFSGLNIISGGAGNDFLMGGWDGETLNGGDGNDVIRADASYLLGGSDLITGGAGDDVMMSGHGADIFRFKTNDGDDVIATFAIGRVNFNAVTGYSVAPEGADFEVGVDKILLRNFFTVNADNVMDRIVDTDDGAQFNGDGTGILFYGIETADLSVSDFMFS